LVVLLSDVPDILRGTNIKPCKHFASELPVRRATPAVRRNRCGGSGEKYGPLMA
jgi:hypothetical protein